MDGMITQLGIGGVFAVLVLDRAVQIVRAKRNGNGSTAALAVQIADTRQSIERGLSRLTDSINANTTAERQTYDELRNLVRDIGALREDVARAHTD